MILEIVLTLGAGVLYKKRTRYWQALPLRSMAAVLLALFLTLGALGFFMDLVEWERLPVWALLTDSTLLGAANVVVFVVMVRRRAFRLLPLAIILGLVSFYISEHLHQGPQIPISDAARSRIDLDAICITSASLLAYWLSLFFISTPGGRASADPD